MKKKVMGFLLIAAVLCAALPISASAESQTNAQTQVSYTVGSNYSINIPSTIDLNTDHTMTITANSVNISYGQRVSVMIDDDNTYENNGNFYLYKDKGTSSESKIPCNIVVNSTVVNGLHHYEVARFDSDFASSPNVYQVNFQPQESGAPGTYTGTICFLIQLT